MTGWHENIKHDTNKFINFYEDFKNNDLKKYPMNIPKLQKFYVYALFKSNQVHDNIIIK